MSDPDPETDAETDRTAGRTDAETDRTAGRTDAETDRTAGRTGADGATGGDGGRIETDVDALQSKFEAAREQVHERIVGQREVVEQLFACILADGNALLESNPGLGKTTMVRTVAEVTDLSYSRIQNTPDLMPSDITGTEIIREAGGEREFVFEKGPVFANLVLADEINRATPKTQAALLEAMQERQVTAAGETYALPEPFFVLATQNPIDQGGTYPLPEAQTDRFMLKLLVGYPDADEERDIVDTYTTRSDPVPVDQVLAREEVRAAQRHVRDVPVADDIRDRAIELVRRTREADAVEFGASPRASMALVVAAKARAFLTGRSHVSGEDVEALAAPVLRHRIILDFEAEREGKTPDDVIASLLE